MSHNAISPVERAVHTTNIWIADVAAQFGTEDLGFAYRVTRAWLHIVRDRLPVVEAAHFGAQLPELLRGVFYEGWDPAGVPVKYGHAEFVTRFADEARVAMTEVDKTARAVSTVFDQHLSGHLSRVLDCVPAELRSVLTPDAAHT